MSSRIAVIDLGTNTFNLLIADVVQGGFTRIYSEEIPVKLGEGGINADIITPEAWSRGLKAVHDINEKIIAYHCSNFKATATSAIRSASNGQEFKNTVKTETGIDIEVINGDREAELIYTGVTHGLTLDSVSLIMDIGGGSVEFIICDQYQIYWKESYPVGAARLKEKFHHSDPINRHDIQLIENHLNESLKALFTQCNIYHPQCLIGSAGAFETFAELVSIKYNQTYDKNNAGFIFRMDQFIEVAEELLASDHSQRENMPGLIPFRVDMIIPATIITQYVLKHIGINSLKLSTYALKEGMLFNVMESLK